MMISVLPPPRPDELFYSIVARHGDWMAYPSGQSLMDDLFGTSRIKAVVDFPSHIETFVANLPIGQQYSADDFINFNTLLPYHRPFLPKIRYDAIKQEMYGNRTQGIHLRLGIIASHIERPQRLKFCPECVISDRKQYDETYWYRTFQLPSVKVCPHHLVWLEESDVPTSGSHDFISAERVIHSSIPRPVDIAELGVAHLVNIAKSSYWLLNSPNASNLDHELRDLYILALMERGFANNNKHVNRAKLVSAISEFYGSDFLRLVDSEIEGRNPRNWITRIFEPNQIQPPLRHLLFMNFLEYDPQTISTIEVGKPPFGSGPWNCLNPICSKYHETVITDAKFGFSQKMDRRPLGTFRCPVCDFTYSRVGPDMNDEDKFRIGRVVKYGKAWDDLLTSLWLDRKISKRDIVAQLGFGIDAIHSQVKRLGLPQKRSSTNISNAPRQIKVIETDEINIEYYRKIWLTEMETIPDVTLIALIRRIPHVYRALCRYDANWLAINKPVIKRKGGWSPNKVAWQERDMLLFQRIQPTLSSLRQPDEKGRLTRITINSIGLAIGLKDGTLQRDLPKMPLSRQIISRAIETHEQFALRRVNYVGQTSKANDIKLSFSQLVKEAGLSKSVQTQKVLLLVNKWYIELREKT